MAGLEIHLWQLGHDVPGSDLSKLIERFFGRLPRGDLKYLREHAELHAAAAEGEGARASSRSAST